MKKEQQPAVLGAAAEAAVALHRGKSASPPSIIGGSSSGSNSRNSSSSKCLSQANGTMISSSPLHRPCSSAASREASDLPLHPCGEVATNAVTTTRTSAVGSVAAAAAAMASPTPITSSNSRGDIISSSILASSPPPFSSSFSSSVCFFASCSPPAPSTSSLSTTTTGTGLLRSICRQCSSSGGCCSCCHRLSPLPAPPPPPPAPPSAAETSKIPPGCCVFEQREQLHSWQQSPTRMSCSSTTMRYTSMCRSRKRASRHVRFPLLLQLPAVTLTTTSLLLLLLLPQGPQQAAAQLKFAALGNWGFESGSQQQVADTLKQVARTEHLSFLVSPGSNFAGGVSGPADPNWKRLFEDVYSDPSAALKMPFFTVLGAEDWSGDYTAEALRTEVAYSATGKYTRTGAGISGNGSTAAAAPGGGGEAAEQETENEEESDTAQTADATAAARGAQIAETYPKWTLPNWWYHYLMHFPASTGSAFINSGHKDMSVGLIFLDTWVLSSSFPFSDIRGKAWEDAEKTLSLAPKLLDYIIVVTDRPVYSSGSSKGDSMLQYYLKPLLEKADVDLLISGYDFSQEVIVHKGISYVNCGAGSFGVGSSMVKDGGSQFYSGQPGFCVFELTADGLITRLVDGLNGETLYVYKQPLKKRPDRKTIDAFKFVSQLPEVKYWAVPSMGKMPGRDVFVRVVGTIGLCIATFFASLSVASLVSRYTK